MYFFNFIIVNIYCSLLCIYYILLYIVSQKNVYKKSVTTSQLFNMQLIFYSILYISTVVQYIIE